MLTWILLFQLLYEDIGSHSQLLETIQAKGESMAQHYVTRLELQELQERFHSLSDKAKVQNKPSALKWTNVVRDVNE